MFADKHFSRPSTASQEAALTDDMAKTEVAFLVALFIFLPITTRGDLSDCRRIRLSLTVVWCTLHMFVLSLLLILLLLIYHRRRRRRS